MMGNYEIQSLKKNNRQKIGQKVYISFEILSDQINGHTYGGKFFLENR